MCDSGELRQCISKHSLITIEVIIIARQHGITLNYGKVYIRLKSVGRPRGFAFPPLSGGQGNSKVRPIKHIMACAHSKIPGLQISCFSSAPTPFHCVVGLFLGFLVYRLLIDFIKRFSKVVSSDDSSAKVWGWR